MLQHGQSPICMAPCSGAGSSELGLIGTMFMPPATEQISRLGTAMPRATVSARDTVGASAASRMAQHAIHRTRVALALLVNMAAL